jgi:hypothetical protein
MFIQSRNVRRKIVSIQQRHRDNQQRGRNSSDQKKESKVEDSISMGSSWLACLLLLCHFDGGITSTERLFAAQSLLHRLRRNKLEDAIDLEIESGDINDKIALGFYRDPDNLFSKLAVYLNVMTTWHPFAGHVLAAAQLDQLNPTTTESQWKGQVTLLTLASVLYTTAGASMSNDTVQSTPLLQTLASALATATLRLLGESDDESFGFVPVLVDVFKRVRATAETASDVDSASASLAYHASLQITLAAVPESLLGSPGGQQRKGRLSLHPNALQKAYADLRQNGFNHLRDIIVSQQHEDVQQRSLWWSLKTLEGWSRFLPVPSFKWELSQPIDQSFLTDKSSDDSRTRTALAYLLAVWEGASCTEEEMLALILGLTAEKNAQQSGKKKQSSRSKKRQKELLDERGTDESLLQARQDVALRGQVACIVAAQSWDFFMPHFQSAMVEANHLHQIDGEGPIGCMAASVQACLPHLLRHPTSGSEDEMKLFAALAEALQHISSSNNQLVRALALEPIYKLHDASLDLVRSGRILEVPLENLLVNIFFRVSFAGLHQFRNAMSCSHFSTEQSSMSLSSSCGYPAKYFDNFTAPSDENFEFYRNDIRDLLRSINGSEEGGSTANVDGSRPPLLVSQKVLYKVIEAIEAALVESRAQHRLPDETAVHAFSALAKPLNHQAQSWDQLGGKTLSMALKCVGYMAECILHGMERGAGAIALIPVARTFNIAVASLAPMLSKLLAVSETANDTTPEIRRVLRLIISTSVASVEAYPELPVRSDPDDTEPRGAMRGPGGEDHVACVALMRLSFESTSLSNILADEARPFLSRICDLYQRLKLSEMERGALLLHTQGTTPKSRRILLKVLCRIELGSQGSAGGSILLEKIFQSAVSSIIEQNGRPWDHIGLLTLCEAAYDLSSFPSHILSSLFESGEHQDICQRMLVDACCHGYTQASSLTLSEDNVTQVRKTSVPCSFFTYHELTAEVITQWNRLRAALFTLISASGGPDIPQNLTLMVTAWTRSECEAICRQCDGGSTSRSSIFVDGIVAEDGVPAGLFVRSICMLLRQSHSLLTNCLYALVESKEAVLTAIIHPCPDPVGFADPRCTLGEAWFLCMSDVASILSHNRTRDARIENMLTDTFCGVVHLLFYPTLGKTKEDRRQDPGMTHDGPQSLALTDFLVNFFQMGPALLQPASEKLAQTISVDMPATTAPVGLVIAVAALFRAMQGSLPPWTVESIPQIFSALYGAVGKDAQLFVHVLGLAMQVRLRVSHYGGLVAGQLLSGGQFEGASEAFCQIFLAQVAEICQTDTAGGWKKMKHVVKSACGGKKKETDYKQKPSPTRWEFDRF